MSYDPGPLPLLVLERHLPGKHDQKDHGRKGMRSHAQIRKTYEMTDEQTGYSTRVDAISTNVHGRTLVDISIRNRHGDDVGWAGFEISPDGKSVEHSGMELTENFQGQGFATRQMVHVVDSYKRSGVKEMTLTANSDVGGYAWARAGFQFRDSAARDTVAAHAHAMARARNYDPDIRAQIGRVANNPNSSPADYAMIGHVGGAKMWPGKEIMLDSTWDGILSL